MAKKKTLSEKVLGALIIIAIVVVISFVIVMSGYCVYYFVKMIQRMMKGEKFKNFDLVIVVFSQGLFFLLFLLLALFGGAYKVDVSLAYLYWGIVLLIYGIFGLYWIVFDGSELAWERVFGGIFCWGYMFIMICYLVVASQEKTFWLLNLQGLEKYKLMLFKGLLIYSVATAFGSVVLGLVLKLLWFKGNKEPEEAHESEPEETEVFDNLQLMSIRAKAQQIKDEEKSLDEEKPLEKIEPQDEESAARYSFDNAINNLRKSIRHIEKQLDLLQEAYNCPALLQRGDLKKLIKEDKDSLLEMKQAVKQFNEAIIMSEEELEGDEDGLRKIAPVKSEVLEFEKKIIATERMIKESERTFSEEG